ncbi:hypothetical protein PG990_014159 [Apiospora arundinis]
MYILLLLTSLLLTVRCACGGPIYVRHQSQGSTGTWTILDHRIACTPAECHYSFTIVEKPTGGEQPQQPQDPTHCEFLVDTDDTHNTGAGTAAAAATLPANRTSFQDKLCGLDPNSYTVNGGFMNSSALVLCFQNPQEGDWAFFGFDPWEFLSGPPKSSPAYPIGAFANGTSSPPRAPRPLHERILAWRAGLLTTG